MQDVLILRAEISAIRCHARVKEISVVMSHKPWSPVAAVVLHGVALPPNIAPPIADLRIPIYNLYGFAEFAARFVITKEKLVDREDGRPVPFCRLLNNADITVHKGHYVDFSEQIDWWQPSYFLCATPPLEGSLIGHAGLVDFVDGILEFLIAPRKSVQYEIASLEARLVQSPGLDAMGYCRLVHLYEGLQECEKATAILRDGASRFPANHWISALTARSNEGSRG
jgi:hypothetical protein